MGAEEEEEPGHGQALVRQRPALKTQACEQSSCLSGDGDSFTLGGTRAGSS
jgi:hypothetical protein